MQAEMRGIVWNWCKRMLRPLDPDVDLSVETWLENCTYTTRKKTMLLDISKSDLQDWHFDSKGHNKKEFYPTPKHTRRIHAQHNRLKVELGPICKAIERVVFALPCFIKKVPVLERAAYIQELL